MDQIPIIGVETLYAIAVLTLASLGLAVIFGMMRVINLAHGEFMALGGYAAFTAHGLGVNAWVAMLVASTAAAAAFGAVVERLLIRRLHGRPIVTMMATWGVSLAMIGGFTMMYGSAVTGFPSPLGGVDLGAYRAGGHVLAVIACAAAVAAGLAALLYGTRAGLVMRGAMQNMDMMRVLGHSPETIRTLTFALGAGLAGLAGGVLAPLTGLNPSVGGLYVAKAFVVVMTAGGATLLGTLGGAGAFGGVSQLFTMLVSPVAGELALLAAAMVIVWVAPRRMRAR